MRPISWLQISDIHMRRRDEWSQDVILCALTTSISDAAIENGGFDFVLVTGDLAFSGQAEEYELVKRFLDAISTAARVTQERIFSVPGNHDVNREKQKLCFAGARSNLTNLNVVDSTLTPDDELKTLLQRQQAYKEFQESYFSAQERKPTPDGLGYVSTLTIDDVVISIVGLNSAWLAQGGEDDHGKLIVGERQVINALKLVKEESPHIVIAMAHHPLHLLQEFDRNAVTNRLTTNCHFFHCGHLHQPEARGAGFDASACLAVSTGATFETREAHNAYSFIQLDILGGKRTLITKQYDKTLCEFSYSNELSFPFQLSSSPLYTVNQLAKEISNLDPKFSPYAHYFSALLLKHKAEFPIPLNGSYQFAVLEVLKSTDEQDFYNKTLQFSNFSNALRVHAKMPLSNLLRSHGQAVRVYGMEILSRVGVNEKLGARLHELNSDVKGFIFTQTEMSITEELFIDLKNGCEWELLYEQAKRHRSASDPDLAIKARRMIALALAHRHDENSRHEAISELQKLIEDRSGNSEDKILLVNLLHSVGEYSEAKKLIMQILPTISHPEITVLWELGQRLVTDTGDREFRERLNLEILKGGNHG